MKCAMHIICNSHVQTWLHDITNNFRIKGAWAWKGHFTFCVLSNLIKPWIGKRNFHCCWYWASVLRVFLSYFPFFQLNFPFGDISRFPFFFSILFCMTFFYRMWQFICKSCQIFGTSLGLWGKGDNFWIPQWHIRNKTVCKNWRHRVFKFKHQRCWYRWVDETCIFSSKPAEGNNPRIYHTWSVHCWTAKWIKTGKRMRWKKSGKTRLRAFQL